MSKNTTSARGDVAYVQSVRLLVKAKSEEDRAGGLELRFQERLDGGPFRCQFR